MGLRDAARLLEPLRIDERLLCEIARLRVFLLHCVQLAQTQQHMTSSNFEIGRVAELQRSLKVRSCTIEVADGHERQPEVVLRAGERDQVPKGLEYFHRASRKQNGTIEPAELAVGDPDVAHELGPPTHVKQWAGALNRLLIETDCLAPDAGGQVRGRKCVQYLHIQPPRLRVEFATRIKRFLPEPDRVRLLPHLGYRRLHSHTFDKRHRVRGSGELSPSFRDHVLAAIDPAELNVGRRQEYANLALARL